MAQRRAASQIIFIFALSSPLWGLDCSNISLPSPQTGKQIFALVASAYHSDVCKRWKIGDLAQHYKDLSKPYFCPEYRNCELIRKGAAALNSLLLLDAKPFFCGPGGVCSPEKTGICQQENLNGEELACEINPLIAAGVNDADKFLAQAVQEEIEIVMEKIRRGLIPYCLLPVVCLENEEQCREALGSLTMESPSNFSAQESHANKSGLKGYRIRRGAFLHLLLANAFSCGSGPQIGGTCSYYSGVNLTSHYCSVPARNPNAKSQCAGRGPDFICISPQEFELRVNAIKAHDHEGASLADLIPIYKELGFEVIFYGKEGRYPYFWSTIVSPLSQGHPLQISGDRYIGNGWGSHAFIVEGVYTDEKGRQRLIVLDSTEDQSAQFLPADTVRERLSEAVMICPLSDVSRCNR